GSRSRAPGGAVERRPAMPRAAAGRSRPPGTRRRWAAAPPPGRPAAARGGVELGVGHRPAAPGGSRRRCRGDTPRPPGPGHRDAVATGRRPLPQEVAEALTAPVALPPVALDVLGRD